MTQTQLKKWLKYDRKSGMFVWVKRLSNRINVGDVAGCIDGDSGYVLIRIRRVLYKASRLAWLYVTGKWPSDHIDHKNRNRADNRLSNLRDATNSVNMQNRIRAQKNNKTGFLGVSRYPFGGGYIAQICTEGKRRRLGVYRSPQRAHVAYIKAKRLLHEGCTI